ncbi:transglutaminase family protein [Aestuariibius insulae]|uniref:transglutaminase family protein n=1 Tax=Aestuariibius insulae TaxID=2058287 RepID=UPI00345ECC96
MNTLAITHRTTYRYDQPVTFAMQQLRLTPKSHNGQRILDWDITVSGGELQLEFEDEHRNRVQLCNVDTYATEIVIESRGTVQLEETNGILGTHGGYVPLWLFKRDTGITRPGKTMRALVKEIGSEGLPLDRLHALSEAIRDSVSYETGQTGADWTGEEAAVAGRGVCQDHAHIFVGCARMMDIPARYVSGYLMMDDRVEQDATHAWAEAYVEGLGWVGFDISNGISPDTRYVRVATGLDYNEAAPIRGTRFGAGEEELDVTVSVQQQQ